VRFALIARIAGIITSDTELDPLLQRAADAIHEPLGFASVDIALIDPADPQTLVISIRGGEYDKRIHQVDRLPISCGIMGAAATTGVTQLVNNVAADPRYVTPPGVTPARAELAVPMQYCSELLGVINVEGDGPYDELDCMSLGIVAEHLAMAVHNARLIVHSRRLVVLEERQRLARELHDHVTQILASISLMAQSLSLAGCSEQVDTTGRARRLAELAQMAFAEMRELLRELSPGEASSEEYSGGAGDDPPPAALVSALLEQHGLATAVTHLLTMMMPDTVALHLDFEGYVPQAVQHERTLLRVCQEGVSNAIRHSGAQRVDVTVRVDDTRVAVAICDDGRGVPADTPRGFGLTSMEQRLSELGGSLRLDPRLLHGTVLTAEVPRLEREPC
jgi:signal transduction histidine kinase